MTERCIHCLGDLDDDGFCPDCDHPEWEDDFTDDEYWDDGFNPRIPKTVTHTIKSHGEKD